MHLIIFFIVIIFSISAEAVDTKAEQAIVMDFNTNEILYEKNADQKVAPASMTKIMTVYAAFDRIKILIYHLSIFVIFLLKPIKWVDQELS